MRILRQGIKNMGLAGTVGIAGCRDQSLADKIAKLSRLAFVPGFHETL